MFKIGTIDKKPGIYYDVPYQEYYEWNAVHKSLFSHIMRSGLQLLHHIEHGEKESDFMRFGNLVDTILFEPHLLELRYIMIPDTYPTVVKKEEIDKPWNWNANYCIDWRKTIPHGITPISKDEHLRAKTISTKIIQHPEASAWLDGAQVQVSIVWVDPETELVCKGRMDAYRDMERIIDLKITGNASPWAFSKKGYEFGYHTQGAFYHDGLLLSSGKTLEAGQVLPFSYIVAEDKQPHDVVTYNLAQESFEAGRASYREALDRFKSYVENDDFQGYSNVAEDFEIPAWALKKYQFEGIL